MNDRLRQVAWDRVAYEQLKRQLAQRGWTDMNANADAEGPLIVEITSRAEVWAESVGWAPGL
ncbi:hypothetical protein OG874_03945 [Nocardia sp. NBC_00565]|uniref:hypothetical protein n=1 Tax=Nocardia sp. NBC_00565 TaxID=2975993 RepID=UPI002E81CECD|nr:hypothetical protein [Nocardia sp. NBC_00565]WUC04369.1 hypothetical protein OG874_03945 [Nocardia sp. NBC_00565]